MPHWVSNSGMIVGVAGIVVAVMMITESRMLPVWIMGCAGVLLCLGAGWYYVRLPSTPPEKVVAVVNKKEEQQEQEIQGSQPRPLFDIGGKARLDISDSRIETPPQGVLRQRGDAQATFNNLSSVDPSSQLVWRNPNAKYSQMPKMELADKAILLATRLRAIHNEYENATRDKMDLRIAQLGAIHQQATAAMKVSYDQIKGECAAVGAALAARQGKQIVSRDQSSIYLGSEVIIRGQLVGIDPVLNAAIALESLASGLR